ncbi:8-oxo-dGTP diphosphatase [Agromyces seonyuensis]|uniref:Oxidized purine nucleoside triphosphate hydrolase n=1 Tax=Agromyces seonyuensis TaxID=2662446 RepID=A0A6I4NY03_9MICO|nr:8-oxo-dGTP diphosphatase [Agromyces seonyuensis]MWB98032.1 NUDIX domain-containing protein [Agromyces seonyuensis]
MGLPQVCVVYVLRERGGRTRVLLGRKREGLGAGRLVGPGGKLEPGETPVQAAVREVREEVGLELDPAHLEARGRLTYTFPTRHAWSQESHVFVCRTSAGEATPSDELDPEWFDLDAVPYADMWDDAARWLPGVLAGGVVRRAFEFAPDLAHVARELPIG